MLCFIYLQILILCDIRYCSSKDPDLILNHREYTVPKIFWELNWLSQRDPKLIHFIKEQILIPPPRVKEPINLLEPFDMSKPWKHQGTHGEALAVESIYNLNKRKQMSGKENGKKYIDIKYLGTSFFKIVKLGIFSFTNG